MFLKTLSSTLLLLAAQVSYGMAACSIMQPPKKDDNTVTLNLYSDEGCCNLVQTMSIGTIGACHRTNQPFTGWTQNVGQNLFGRDLHIGLFGTNDCLEENVDFGIWFSLTNQPRCPAVSPFGFNSIVLGPVPN